MGGPTGGVMLIMLAILGLYLVWKTDVIDRIVGGAASLQSTRTA